MKNSGSFAGKRAGWPVLPTILQAAMYFPFDSVFGNWSRLGGIAPPLSLPKLMLMSCPEGRFFAL